MKPLVTLTGGQLIWFVARGETLRWALLHPYADGSASIRSDEGFRTFAPPHGGRDALEALEEGGFVELDEARALGGLPADVRPPAW